MIQPSYKDEVFEVTGPDSFTRRGIVSLPMDLSQVRVGVVFLAAGLKYRTGPHRWFVRFARELAKSGLVALRIDPLGIGESDGAIAKAPTFELWQTVEHGRFVPDAILAAQSLKSQFNLDSVILMGLCGGAITAQLAAAARPDLISGVISFNSALTISEGRKPRALNQIEAKHNVKTYLKKLFSPSAWFRILRGKTDLKHLTKNMKAALPIKTDVQALPEENPAFVPSFRKMRKSGQQHLMIFSEFDSRWFEFSSSFLKRELKGELAGPGYEIQLIAQANHLLFLRTWQNAAETRIQSWIKQF